MRTCNDDIDTHAFDPSSGGGGCPRFFFPCRVLWLTQRDANLSADAAGLRPVLEVSGVENVDASSVVRGHTMYPGLIPDLLDSLVLVDE